MIVVDVNILAHYVIQGERTEHVHRLWALDDGWIVPFFWRVEFQSILWKCVRFQGMSRNEALALLDQAIRLFAGNEQHIAHDAALQEAMASEISVYDAQYVALARQCDVPFVTMDQRLQKSCPGRACSIDQFLSGRAGGGTIREPAATYRTKGKDGARRKPAPRKQNRQTKPA